MKNILPSHDTLKLDYYGARDRMTDELDCFILPRRQTDEYGRQYRLVQCWCGNIVLLNSLGRHLRHKHNQSRDDVNVYDD